MLVHLRPRLSVVGYFLPAVLAGLVFFCQACHRNVVVPESHFVRGPGQKKLIVFVHGVLGDMDNTWIDPGTRLSWPALIAGDVHSGDPGDPDLKNFDVFVYGYYSPAGGNASTISEIADRFGQQLRDWKLFTNYEEIDFITHSMGGIITKRMLDTLNTPVESVNLHRVHCVLYISVPANGAELASLASWISNNPQLKSMSPRGAADFLQAVEGDWGTVLRERTPTAPFPRSFSAYEKLNVHGLRVVPQLYISGLGDAKPIAFDYDHFSIVKPKDRGNEVYDWAKVRILESSSYPVERPKNQLVSGHAVLFDAFKDADHSGLRFSDGAIVSFFSGQADLMVSNTNPPQEMAQFFVQADEGGVFQNAAQDKGARGGVRKMLETKLEDVTECPANGYGSHWFSVNESGVYCVMARDGHHYAKVQITSLQNDRIAFDWLYQPGQSRSFQ